MAGSNRALRLVEAGLAHSKRPIQERQSVVDRGPVPERPVLVLQEDEVTPGGRTEPVSAPREAGSEESRVTPVAGRLPDHVPATLSQHEVAIRC